MLWGSAGANVDIHESGMIPAGQMEVTSFEEAEQASEEEKVPDAEAAVEASPKQDWKAQRQQVWGEDEKMLQQTDKVMHDSLKRELSKPGSVQWARYMRHKNIQAPAKEGHSWDVKGVTNHGVINELAEKEKKETRLCDKSVNQHHGYFKIDKRKSKKNYFYWFFEAREAPHDSPLILWLTGGPGCSGEIALFTENGPCQITKDGKKTTPNKFSWNSKANLLFVDQPAGAGFSFGDESDNTEKMVSNDLYHFLQEFVKKYPKYHKLPFYIFGESYAGHFVPALGHRVFTGNKNKDGEYLALKGIGIGNGLTDPATQYAYYPQMAFNSATTPKAVSKERFAAMERAVPKCTSYIKSCEKDHAACGTAFNYCAQTMISPIQERAINVYDLRQKCLHPPLCYDMSAMSTFLSSKTVKKKLGVKKSWRECNFGVNGRFHTDWMISQKDKIPPLLKNGIRTIVYAGDVDFICNWMGNKAWTLNMDWHGKKGFNAAKDKAWKMDNRGKKNEVVGRERTHGGFTFLQIHKAGHMVPMDQPKVALHMLNSFLAGKVLVQED